MDFNQGFTLPQKKDFEVQIPWAPVTPAKSLPTRTLIPGNGHRNVASGCNRLETAHVLSGTCSDRFSQEEAYGRSDSCSYTDGLQYLQGTEAAVLPSYSQIQLNQVGSYNARPSMPALSNPIESWAQQTPYLNLMAYTDAAAANQVPFFTPLMFSQMGGGVERHVLQNQFLLNEQALLEPSLFDGNNNSVMKALSEPSLFNGNNGSTMKAQNGVAFPFSSTSNSFIDKTVDKGGSNTILYPFTPFNREKNKSLQDQIPSEVINLDGGTEGNLWGEAVKWQAVTAKQVDLCSWTPVVPSSSDPLIPSMSESRLPSDLAVSQQQKSEGKTVPSSEKNIAQQINVEKHDNLENKGIDLNKTPTQRPKRKKHRPKVIREKKPTGARKSAAHKPVTPKTPKNLEENPPGKRKYVRRKKVDNPIEKGSMTPEDTADSNNRIASKSVRRCLNFDSEVPQARNEPPGLSMVFTHNEACQEQEKTPPSKRKYVRKKKVDNPTEKASGATQDTVEPNHGVGSQSVRRCLNFDSEVPQARDEPPGLSMMFTSNEACQAREAWLGDTTSSSTSMSSWHPAQGLEVVADNSATRITFDLNSSMHQNTEYMRNAEKPTIEYQPFRRETTRTDQMLDDWRTMPENLMPSSVPSKRELVKETLNRLSGKCDYLTIATNSDKSQESGTTQLESHEILNLLTRKTKRNYDLNNDAQVSRNKSITETYDGNSDSPFLPPEYKKQRKFPEQNRFTYTTAPSSAYMPLNDSRNDQVLLDKAEFLPSISAQRSMAPEDQQHSKCISSFKQAEESNSRKMPQVQSEPPSLTCVKYSSSSKMDQQNASASVRKSTLIVGQQNQLCEPKSFIDTPVGDDNTAKKPKRRTKKEIAQTGIPLMNMQSHRPTTYNVEFSSYQKTPKNAAFASGSFRGKTLPTSGSIPEGRSTNYIEETSDGSLTSRKLILYGDPLGDIIQKLRHLTINGASEGATTQPQNAIVPYDGGGVMVPYKSLNALTKKRRPRPKVDLDPETNRVWNFLMGKEGGDNAEGTECEKQKWWEEERRVFRGRVDSFIARMHLVQGDRRFSKWKGSVVDSVVGVFLTQNVSDHLSSSAFMSLAAKFSLDSRGNDIDLSAEKKDMFVEHLESCTVVFDETTKLQGQMLGKESYDEDPLVVVGENETVYTNESLGSNDGICEAGYSKVKCLHTNELVLEAHRQSPDSGSGTPVTLTGSTSEVEAEDRWSLEDVLSSQNSVVSSQNSSRNPLHSTERTGLCSLSNAETEDMINGRMCSGMDNLTSFRELLRMADRTTSTTYYGGIGWVSPTGDQMRNSFLSLSSNLSGKSSSMCTPNVDLQNEKHVTIGISATPQMPSYANKATSSSFSEMVNVHIQSDESRFYEHQTAFEINPTNNIEVMETQSGPLADNRLEGISQQKWANVSAVDLYARENNSMQQIARGRAETCLRNQFCSHDKLRTDMAEASIAKSIFSKSSYLADQCNANSQQMENTSPQAVATQQVQHPMQNFHNQQNSQKLQDKQIYPVELSKEAELDKKVDAYETVAAVTQKSKPREKKVKGETEKKKNYDWDSLRKAVHTDGYRKERSHDTVDTVDWEAVRCAEVNKISETIRERGMNNMLAERIKEFLNRLVRDHGSIDLEWLRDVEPDKAKDYLLSVRGLGLKSVECVRLLTLHHLAFPVDTNVGRICVRLGWVPLQPLPESLQLHLLELYPVLETIQKYLWPRLCKLDQRTLYELHYQMITFGKVFCTKSKPNCNACPMRGECKHFASAFASARLALPGPEDKSLVCSTSSNAFDKNHKADLIPMLLHLEGSKQSDERTTLANCAPIIEEPATPEAECIETEESAIEDAFYEDPDEIPMIKLNFEEFTQNLQSYMQANNMEIQDGDMSKALVAINPEDASIPMPKLKNISRLRTEHYVYELPDSHPLLEGFERREPDDPSSYLLAIWTPGETAQSIEPSQESCNSQETGKLCSRIACFSCNSIREAEAQTVRGTLLIPCRTAMRGSFPLNGTYFQVNEVFADHETSRSPIDVPRSLIWNLPRRTVYFGTSVPSIFKGLRTEEIQQCFWRGFVCVRGFDRTTRAPKPLYARLHFPASKTTRSKKAAAATAREE